ncbi:MAG: hypothetical protein R2795_13905 [Saprospiraceae bacterium]
MFDYLLKVYAKDMDYQQFIKISLIGQYQPECKVLCNDGNQTVLPFAAQWLLDLLKT